LNKESNNSKRKKNLYKSSKASSRSNSKKQMISEQESLYQIDSRKTIDDSWDFRKSNTKEFTHCFHQYPAMMIPQVARRILDNFGNGAKVLFDPYCGTGTSLVEANLKGINAIGTDLNPLARLISSAKTTEIDIQVLDLFLHDFMNYSFSMNFQTGKIRSVLIPQVKNIDFWFSKDTQYKLAILLKYIDEINDNHIKNFFKVAFSETVREASFVKPGEFKLVRKKNYTEKEEKDVFGIMISKLSRNKRGLIEFQEFRRNGATTIVYDFNTVDRIPENVIKPNSIDIVLTSPPYGDSKTTVAYGQYSRLSNDWLGYKEANKIDNLLMGGKKQKNHHRFNSEILNDVIDEIQKYDKVRAGDVISFYEDYEKSISNISKSLKRKGFVCFVVGNRTVKGINIPTDVITSDFFRSNNFSHIETIVRNIPNKRMPLKNSPSNIVGETAPTMKNEYIVICQKR